MVYLTAHLEQGKVWFQGDADSHLVKGLLAILITGLSGMTPTKILQVSPYFIQETGLSISLTPSRNNGFINILNRMKQSALEFMSIPQNTQE